MLIKSVLSIARGRQCYLHQSLSSQCLDIYNKSASLQPLSVSLHTSPRVTSALATLRKNTGYSLSICKKALRLVLSSETSQVEGGLISHIVCFKITPWNPKIMDVIWRQLKMMNVSLTSITWTVQSPIPQYYWHIQNIFINNSKRIIENLSNPVELS